ncbi:MULTISPECIES: GlxA family transcriptional regulator [unclassified Achromobacter]|uniref:GlxA family transcriptional regulator n=1 Tax=unclassified Achromobacter TaxID=2626865 RepID=UPI000B5171E3|nr:MULTISPECIES: GlxA family transcriptional regulator [unclassified Achromobacter]OWT75384.1 AraC family transcriptional regulator [Achromobacter sp. HZ28]OWT76044.1 AraC family transcriptional regulator [Achromobacter sp. HZ34]
MIDRPTSATKDPQTKPSGKPELSVGILLLDQFTLAAFSGFVDALRLAGDHGGLSRRIHATWRVMSWDGLPRTSSAGLTLAVDGALAADPAEFDYIAICGGNDYPNMHLPAPLRDWLHLAVERRVRLLGICTATFALAQAGLLGSRSVCVHWNVLDAFRARFPAVRATVDQLFIDEGDLITCAGSTAAIDLALYLVERHCGRDKAQQAVRHMMLQGVRPARMPQAHFYTDVSAIQDLRVRQAAHFIEQRVDDPPSLDAIARYVGVGRRQLERAFQQALGVSPIAFRRDLRLQYGRWLLEQSGLPVTQVALDCGFADGAHFAREFRGRFGVTPRQYKRTRMAS